MQSRVYLVADEDGGESPLIMSVELKPELVTVLKKEYSMAGRPNSNVGEAHSCLGNCSGNILN